MKSFWLLALAGEVWAQTLSGPATVTVGDPVFLRLADGVRPIAGVTLRVTAPALETGTVGVAGVNLRATPAGTVRGKLQRGDQVLIKGQTGDGWCEVVLAHGGTGYVACEYLDRAPYGQPLGTTDVDGRVVVPNFGVVPGRVTVAGGGATFSVQVLPLVYDQRATIAPGISWRSRRWVPEGDGPFSMEVVEVDPGEPNVFLLPVRARDQAVGMATTSSMAKRYGAVAAVNGGPFGRDGTSLGTYQLDEQVMAGSLTDHTALLRCLGGGLDVAAAPFRGSVTAGSATIALTGVNRTRGAQDLILFQSGFGGRTGTGAGGIEVVLDTAGRVRSVFDGQGNAAIPADGQVLSGSGEAAAFLRRNAGANFTIRFSPVAVPGCSAVDVVGGGPRLVANGRVDIGEDGFGNERMRAARTAFALTSRGTWLLVTLDGRPGMRVDEFAAELVTLGVVKAVNLDGGASTTMVVEDAVRNGPSEGTERGVSDGVLVFSVHDLESLRLVLDRVTQDPGQVNAAAIGPLYQRLDSASAAFAADELEQVRVDVEALRGEITRRSGGELTRAAVRVLVEATNAYLRLLPGIQQGLRARKPVR